MLKIILWITLLVPFSTLGFTDEESDLRDNLVKEHKNSPELEQKIKSLNKELDKSFVSRFLDKEMKEALGKMIAQNPFQYMSDAQAKKLLVARGGKSLADNPKLLSALSEWIRDKDALPKFLSIVGEGEKLKKYGLYFLVVFIVAFILNLKNSKNSILKRLIFKIMLMITTGIVNLSIFYILFKEELGPTIRIAKKYLIS